MNMWIESVWFRIWLAQLWDFLSMMKNFEFHKSRVPWPGVKPSTFQGKPCTIKVKEKLTLRFFFLLFLTEHHAMNPPPPVLKVKINFPCA
jgi:hypothetical protein